MTEGSVSQPDIDALIDEIAARQHGVVSRAQLLLAGGAAHRIEHRVRMRRLHIVHRGVYRVGPLVAARSPEMTAVLACGGGSDAHAAVISHRSAAALSHQMPSLSRTMELIVPGWRGRRLAGLRVHRIPDVAADEVTRIDGIPVTVPARTLLDLASVLPRRDLERALARTYRLELATDFDIRAMLARHPRRAGTRRLYDLLDQDTQPAFTRSQAEDRLVTLIRKARLAKPEVNVVVEGFEVDLLWRRQRLVVEVDGFAYHGSRRTFERDRARDAVLIAAGLRVLRLSWRQIVNEPESTIARLALAIAR